MMIYGFTTWGQMPLTLAPDSETTTIWKYYRTIAGEPLLIATDSDDVLLGLAAALERGDTQLVDGAESSGNP